MAPDSIYIRDPDRILRDTRVGQVQAWSAKSDDVAVVIGTYAHIQDSQTKAAYYSNSLYMTAADARDLARVLIEAADHAEKVCTGCVAEAA